MQGGGKGEKSLSKRGVVEPTVIPIGGGVQRGEASGVDVSGLGNLKKKSLSRKRTTGKHLEGKLTQICEGYGETTNEGG